MQSKQRTRLGVKNGHDLTYFTRLGLAAILRIISIGLGLWGKQGEELESFVINQKRDEGGVDQAMFASDSEKW